MSETVEETPVHVEEGEKEGGELTDKGKLLEMEEVQGAQPTTSQPQSYQPVKQTTPPEASEGESEACATCLQIFSILILVLFFPFSLLCALQMVQEYERAVIFRLGRIIDGGAKGPGLFFVYPCMDSVTKVDMRTKAFDINPQEILTKDQLTVMVDAVMYTRIIDPVLSITKIENVDASTKLLGATTLRNTLGTYNMTDILSKRDEINSQMKILLDEATDAWGVDVERVEITDVRLPEQMQRAMAAEAEATREARAKVIAAEGEQKASRALKEAADVMTESPAAMQLRYLQTLNTISAEKNSTIIFPLPLEFMQSFRAPPSQGQ